MSALVESLITYEDTRVETTHRANTPRLAVVTDGKVERGADSGAPQPSFIGTALEALGVSLVSLGFFLGFPVIGLSIVGWYAVRAVWKRRTRIGNFVKDVALFFAAPFIALIYALTFPFVLAGFLIAKGLKALSERRRDAAASPAC